jgi:hypothetical protein
VRPPLSWCRAPGAGHRVVDLKPGAKDLIVHEIERELKFGDEFVQIFQDHFVAGRFRMTGRRKYGCCS